MNFFNYLFFVTFLVPISISSLKNCSICLDALYTLGIIYIYTFLTPNRFNNHFDLFCFLIYLLPYCYYSLHTKTLTSSNELRLLTLLLDRAWLCHAMPCQSLSFLVPFTCFHIHKIFVIWKNCKFLSVKTCSRSV